MSLKFTMKRNESLDRAARDIETALLIEAFNGRDLPNAEYIACAIAAHLPSITAEAVAAERERCAQLAESYGGSKFEYECVGREIARAIRGAT